MSQGCIKCGNTGTQQGQFQATGGTLSKLFDVQTEKFQTISCTKCGYTEIYKRSTSAEENLLDLFFGG